MHPVVRTLGKVLRLVGISSPEDSEAKKETPGGPPSWRNTPVALPDEQDSVDGTGKNEGDGADKAQI